MIILGMITLTISVNNIIVLINFFSLLIIIGYELFGINCVEITLLIIIIYSSGFLCLFLMNGFIFISYFSMYLFYINPSYCCYDNLFIYFPCIWSVFLEIGWNRFGNIVFDNNLLILTILLFCSVSFNIKSLSIYYLSFLLMVIYFKVVFLLAIPPR